MEGFIDCSQMMRGGVYLLKHRGEVVYIGKAKCFLSRVYSHRSVWGRARKGEKVPSWLAGVVKGLIFDQIYLRPCTPDKADLLERELIALFKPRHNIQHIRDTAPLSVVLAAAGLAKPQPRSKIERRF
jgi:excinuclease UvrABC nuclease subunit